MKTYIRDKRSPKPSNAIVSKVMSANKGKDSKPEVALRKLLELNGVIDYDLHNGALPGRPDISIRDNGVAIFLNGCFWHRCPSCAYKLPKNNRSFWKAKFERNVKRDLSVRRKLRRKGWKAITVWECKLKAAPEAQIKRILRYLNIGNDSY